MEQKLFTLTMHGLTFQQAKNAAEGSHGCSMMYSKEEDGVFRAYPNGMNNRVEIKEASPVEEGAIHGAEGGYDALWNVVREAHKMMDQWTEDGEPVYPEALNCALGDLEARCALDTIRNPSSKENPAENLPILPSPGIPTQGQAWHLELTGILEIQKKENARLSAEMERHVRLLASTSSKAHPKGEAKVWNRRQEATPAPLVWNREKPKVPGVYRLRGRAGDNGTGISLNQIVAVAEKNGELYTLCVEDGADMAISKMYDHFEWVGPYNLPTPPVEAATAQGPSQEGGK